MQTLIDVNCAIGDHTTRDCLRHIKCAARPPAYTTSALRKTRFFEFAKSIFQSIGYDNHTPLPVAEFATPVKNGLTRKEIQGAKNPRSSSKHEVFHLHIATGYSVLPVPKFAFALASP